MDFENLPEYGANVRAAGARGDGTGDDGRAFQQLTDSDERLIVVPAGTYSVATPIRLRSGTRLIAHPAAVIRLADGAELGVKDALVSNANWDDGDSDISLEGGIWDGNCLNVRRAAEDERTGYTGNLLLFRNVKGFSMKDMTLRDPSSYFVCLGKVVEFSIQDIRLRINHHTRNQDGIHVSGGCSDGLIREIHATGRYCPGDDLVALNADDALDRSETRSALAGDIRRIRVHGLYAEDCHAFVRLASVWSTIEDVYMTDFIGGCTCTVVNADGLRFCRSPLFETDDVRFAGGVGNLRNIRLERLRVHKTSIEPSPLLQLHTRMQGFDIKDFRREVDRDCAPEIPTIDIAFVPEARGFLEGVCEATMGQQDAQSSGVVWTWAAGPLAALNRPGLRGHFALGESGRLRACSDAFHWLRVEQCSERPLPEPNWNVGMRF
jgi:polygalacturonase